jgi:peptide/nickel transport system ATP-binding protein
MLDASTAAALVGVVAEQARGGTGVLAVSHDEELLAVWADRVERPFEKAGHPR